MVTYSMESGINYRDVLLMGPVNWASRSQLMGAEHDCFPNSWVARFLQLSGSNCDFFAINGVSRPQLTGLGKWAICSQLTGGYLGILNYQPLFKTAKKRTPR